LQTRNVENQNEHTVMPADANFFPIFQSATDCIPKSALLDRPQQKVHILSPRATSINHYDKTTQQYQGQEEVLLLTSAIEFHCKMKSKRPLHAAIKQHAAIQLHAGRLVEHERKINPTPTKSKPPLHSSHFPIRFGLAMVFLFLEVKCQHCGPGPGGAG
jgi:hypothetical protein